MRTEHPVECNCGHVGIIKMSENDQPFSDPWEKYTLQGLKGSGEYYVDGCAKWETVFQNLQPQCPQCENALTPGHLNRR